VPTNKRTDTHTHGLYQTYYRPCYAVDKNLISTRSRQEARESVLRKEKRVYGGNDLKKKIGFKLGVRQRELWMMKEEMEHKQSK